MSIFLSWLSSMQSASFLRSIILSSVACPALQYFFTLSNKRHDFRKKKKVIEHKMCVMIFFTPFVWNISHSENWARYDQKCLFFFYIHVSVNRNVIPNYQQDATFLSFFIYFYRRSTCFRRFLRPSSGAHNCTYSCTYMKLYIQLYAPDDGRRNSLKHVQLL